MSTRSTCAADADASFDNMPDDIVSSVLGAVAVSASSSAEFLSATMVCKRFLELGMNIAGTKNAGARCFAVRAKSWCMGARRFLQRCAEAGNLDAAYILGMILFYCLKSHEDGVAKIFVAASQGHQEAMYSLAVIMFNGSGGGEEQRDICTATALCAHAASLVAANAGEEMCMCSNMLCGRQETRPREFRRCAVCSTVIYCSCACQSRHWTTHHWRVCAPV